LGLYASPNEAEGLADFAVLGAWRGSRLQHAMPSRAAPTTEPVALVLRSTLLSENSWSRHNCNIELRGKLDKLITAILLHLDGSLVLKSFSDCEEVCLEPLMQTLMSFSAFQMYRQ
jgi:hypothetical protein